jgi:hypothetical protein
LKNVVFGQDKAIDALVLAIRMARSGLGNPRKPIGNFLFSGPTGVGKTEGRAQLAYCLGVELLRFDMSEYMERHAVSRLIGAPPGYIGFDQGGQLTEAITKHPYSVLLMDEIEKAHPDIFNILLQVMDHGTLTDNNGRKADFRNVTIIMTTNAGAASSRRARSASPTRSEAATRWPRSGVCSRRSSATVSTRRSRSRSSDHDVILKVVDKFLLELEDPAAREEGRAVVHAALKEFLAQKGFDPQMGARPMARLIQDTIRKALADELLFGRLVRRRSGDDRRRRRREVRLVFAEKEEAEPVRLSHVIRRLESGACGRRFALQRLAPLDPCARGVFFANNKFNRARKPWRKVAAVPLTLLSGDCRDCDRGVARSFLSRARQGDEALGDGFIKLIKMLIAPIIFCTVVVGIAGMESMKTVGKTGGLALSTSRSSAPSR